MISWRNRALIPAGSISRMELDAAEREGAVGEGCGHSGENKYEFQPPLIANRDSSSRCSSAVYKVMSCREKEGEREREESEAGRKRAI